MAELKDTRKHTSGTDRRNVWLIVLTTLLVIGSTLLFTPPQERINQGLDIQGGLSVVLSANATDGGSVTEEDMEISRDIIESRVNALGASEATVQRQGNNQILVQIPGLSDTQEALNAIGKTGKLEFARLDSFTDETVRSQIDSGQISTQNTYSDDYGNSLPAGTTTNLTVEEGTYEPIVTGSNIQRVDISLPEGSIDWAVNVQLDSEGTRAFADASRDLVDEHGKIVIILDNEVNSAPAVQSEIPNGQVQITGGYTQDGAKALKTVLESGSLPVSFTYAQSQTVGPTLGQSALSSGVLVALIGLALVMLYLLVFYHGLGLITAAAMAVFAVLYLGLLALLSRFGLFSLSLSGVAGVVLTIGMAADSSILTLERFREEIRFGRSVRAASITGVRHGILTSIDADVVTLVAALTLFFLASSGVKGFGLTLALGVMCDILMMLIFKAPLIRLLAPRVIAKNPGFWGIKDCQTATEVYQRLADIEGETVETAASAESISREDNRAYAERKGGAEGVAAAEAISGLRGRFIKHDINFLGLRKIFLAIAAVAMVAAIALIGVRGLNLGIEFRGGTSITFTQAEGIDTEELRSAFADAGEPDAVIQTAESNGEEGFIVRTTESDAATAAGKASQVAEALGLTTDNFQVDTISPDWGPTIVRSMFLALMVTFLLVIAYIGVRFRDPKMGVVAVIVLLHDILFVVGVYALAGREFNPNTIAALLTILGYSLYDTVVVFHRINENVQNSNIKCNFMTMANHSLNQVFLRSVNTSVTSLIPVLFMLIFGSETLKDFAFAMVIGLVVGFYSSIAIAAPLYSIWKSREEKNVKLAQKYGTEVGRFEFAHGALSGTRAAKPARSVAAPDAATGDEVAAEATVQTDTRNTGAAKVEVATGAQQAKAKRAKKRAAEAKKAQKKAANEAKKEAAATGVPEIRIVDQEKFDATTTPEPAAPKRGFGRYSEANRAAAEEQYAELAAARAEREQYDTLDEEMEAAARMAEAFDADVADTALVEESAVERAERQRREARLAQAERDRAAAEARRAKREAARKSRGSRTVATGTSVVEAAREAVDKALGAGEDEDNAPENDASSNSDVAED